MKINETIKLDLTGTKYSGTGVLDLLETDGSVRASFSITTQAQLIGVELQKR